MTRNALVTGGAGFIGSHLVERLLGEGWRVRVLDNLSTGSRGVPRSDPGQLTLLQGDIRDQDTCQQACRGVDSVFHLAAVASVASSRDSPALSQAVNLSGTLNLLTAARDQDVRRFVFSSSASVYGNADTVPTDEEQPLRPRSPYATEKACGEFYCRNFREIWGLETVILRYFNVFGPRQSARAGDAAVIPGLVQAALAGEAPVVYGDGRQTRDFVYVGDIVAANKRAALADGAAGQTFNIAGGEAVSVLDLLAELRRLTGARLNPVFQTARAGEVRHSCADISRARRMLGYRPEVSFAQGLWLTVEAAMRAGGEPCFFPKLAA
jgi:nucleoside-diphosphate-sugar epimerase